MSKRIFNFAVLLIFLMSWLGAAPITSVAARSEPEADSPVDLINPDGTLNLSTGFSGSMDLSDYSVALDPQRGPVFSREDKSSQTPQNLPSLGDWENLGGGVPPFNGMVYAIAVSGTDVYVGGDFQNLNGIPEADGIARWDGSNWHALGSNGIGEGALNNSVYAIAVDGSNIYVGGNFINVNNNGNVLDNADFIARWDGTNWYGLGQDTNGSGSLNSHVLAIAVDNNYVYAGGAFSNVDNNGSVLGTADHIAAYDKSTTDWMALGSNGSDGAIDNDVLALAINDSGLYVGGQFFNAAGIPNATFIAKWDGSAWSALGDCSGSPCLNSSVNTIALKGSGVLTQVWVGGNFNVVLDALGGAQSGVQYMAYFDGSDWGAITSGNPINGPVHSIVYAGSNEFYITGEFTDAGGVGKADYLAKLSGSTWSGLASGILTINGPIQSPVQTIAVSGNDVYAGGDFTVQGSLGLIPTAKNFAHWDGSDWTGTGSLNGALNHNYDGNNSVWSIVTIGTDVYVGGSFTDVAGIPEADYIAKWDGSNWSALGSDGGGNGALNERIVTLAVLGTDLYVGGYFTDAAGIPEADRIAKWDTQTSSWSALGSGVSAEVYSIAIDGQDVYVGGYFTDVEGIPAADYIAKWDSHYSSWSALGNYAGNGALNDIVNEIVIQDGNLYAGGIFTNAAGLNAADHIARWDGTSWSALGDNGSGDGAINDQVLALAVSGSNLYVGGWFTNAGSIPEADHLAVWDGTNWSAVDNANVFSSYLVYALATNGSMLYVAGPKSDIAGIPEADFIARWDGSNWSALGSNGAGDGSLNAPPNVIYLSSVNNAIYVGGDFTDVNNNGTKLTEADFVAAYGTDLTPPVVSSIARADTSPTNASSVDFDVTFSETVTGVDLNDFSLTMSGVSGATVSGVSGSDSSYTVTVNTGSGDGTLGLNLADDDSIVDTSGNPLGGTGQGNGDFIGDAYAVAKTAPVPQLPADGAALNNRRPFFDWSDFANAKGYQLQVSKSTGFGTKLLSVSLTGATNSQYTPTKDLPANATLYWRVRGKLGSTKYTAWSSVFSFHTGNPPSVPSLLSPANGALLTNLSPTLDWADSTVPAGTSFDHYQLQLDDTADFSSPVADVNLSGVTNSFYAAGPLNANTKYYWHVRAWNTSGEYSGWSLMRSFRESMVTPVLISPIGGVTVGSLMPTFDWDDVPGATGYTIQVSLKSNFSTLVFSVTLKKPTSMYAATKSLSHLKTYYWRVRANGPNGPTPWTVDTFMTP